MKVQIWTVPFDGGDTEAAKPKATNQSSRRRATGVASSEIGAIWQRRQTVRLQPGERLSPRAANRAPAMVAGWHRLAFVSGRSDHSMIGVYTDDATPIE